MQIRRARPDEAEALTAMAHAAKRHWGYPEKWIEEWKSELTITPQFITDHEVFAAIVDGEIAGCCALVLTGAAAELEHMWIEPRRMRTGVGRALFQHLTRRVEQLGLNEVELSADPNAEGFYERMGATRIGEVPADVDGNQRVLPRMKLVLGVAPAEDPGNREFS